MDAAGSDAGTENTNAPVSVRGNVIARDAAMTDAELMREAVAALKAIRDIATWNSQTNPFHAARLANIKGVTLAPIFRLEQRLLNE
jgi:hypothetical protein